MKVNLLFGFLGSGKTTLVRHILGERAKQQSLAVIVNEFGDVGVDGVILEGRNVDVVELTSGCLCCTLKGSLLNAIEELEQAGKVDQIVVEATGVAHPEEMLETFSDSTLRSTIDLGPLVTVINAPKFSVLRQGLGDFYTDQVRRADVLLLNKIDLAEPEQLEAVHQEIKAMNPKAAVLFTEQCDTDVGLILDGEDSETLERRDDGGGHAHTHRAHPHVDSFVLDSSGDAKRADVEHFFAQLPEHVWRVKGFMNIEGQSCLVQFATGQLDITPAGNRQNPRMVFIGRNLDQTTIEAQFAFARAAGNEGGIANVSGDKTR
ncbi:MAG: CobW family GTP-binding protein [Acidiferrobacterales bacterium]